MDIESTELEVEFEVDPETAWLEEISLGGFRAWHLMFFSFCGFILIIVILCCCARTRIPRTKQEIEADYIRKRITKTFRERLSLMNNSDMNNLDLQKGFVRRLVIEPNRRWICTVYENCKMPSQKELEKSCNVHQNREDSQMKTS